MQETVHNEYSYHMNLTIRSLEKRDFGGYVCTSSNALGKAEGVVRLQGIYVNCFLTKTAINLQLYACRIKLLFAVILPAIN